MPTAFETVKLPVFAEVGTTAVIVVVLTTVNRVALTPPNLTPLVAVMPVKLAPVMVTVSPDLPLVADKLVIVGAREMAKLVDIVAVPPSVVSDTAPVVAPAGTVITAEVPQEFTTTLEVVTAFANVARAPYRLFPVTVKVDPTAPEILLTVEIDGAVGKLTLKLIDVDIADVVTESLAKIFAT